MRKTTATIIAAALALTASAAEVLTKAQRSFFQNRRIAVSRDTTTLPGYVITTWHRNGKLDTLAPAVVTNELKRIVGAEQKNHVQAKLEELRKSYAAATNSLLNAEARAARLDALRAYLVEQRDKAVLSTTKAVCQAIIDRIDGKEN